MSLVKQVARWVLHEAGGLHLARIRRRGELRILMYHGFPDGQREALERQCEHIRAFYKPVSLDEVAEWLDGRWELPPNALAVTVDDGYRNFARNAWPLFSAYGIPAAVYLVTGFCDRRLWLWTDQVSWLYDAAGRSGARDLVEQYKKMPDAERRVALAELPGRLGVLLPEQPPAAFEALSWDEARRLAGEGVTFGCHTDTHPILGRLPDEKAQREEIVQSRNRVAAELGGSVRHFCYPNGKVGDFNSTTVRLLQETGFTTATVTSVGFNRSGVDRYRLERIGVEPDLPWAYFTELLAGLHGVK
jgi:peptidoglycan/xylan/chitin deacetylase (PgdA/CDA1 family)